MLENFIEGNQRQMQHLSDEINRVGNIALNNNQYLRVLKRHSWKGLRKFHSIEKLRDARIYKEYPHLQRNFARNDSIDRPNPKIPSLEKIDEVLFVNPADQFARTPSLTKTLIPRSMNTIPLIIVTSSYCRHL